MAYTYSKIATYTVGSGGISSINFLNIPQTYTDLAVSFSVRGSRSAAVDFLQIKFNGSSSNYSARTIYVSGATGQSFTETSIYVPVSGNNATASTFGNASFYIPNYTSSNNKSVNFDAVQENNDASLWQMYLLSGSWSNTSPITSIELTPLSGYGPNILQHSTAHLYGIKAEL
jgi:hypothetical protein